MSQSKQSVTVAPDRFFKYTCLGVILITVLITALNMTVTLDETRSHIREVQMNSAADSAAANRKALFADPAVDGYKLYYYASPFLSFMGVAETPDKQFADIGCHKNIEIYKSVSGLDMFGVGYSPMRISSILLVLFTLCCMVYGLYTDRRIKDYRDRLLDYRGNRILGLVLRDAGLHILLVIPTMVVTAGFILHLNGITPDFSRLHLYVAYVAAAYLMLVGFYLLGFKINMILPDRLLNRDTAGGAKTITVKTPQKVITALFCWLVLVGGVTVFLDVYIKNNLRALTSESASRSTHMSSVGDSLNGLGKKTAPNARYLGQEPTGVTAADHSKFRKTAAGAQMFNRLSIYTPVTFFRMIADDVAGLGYTAFLDFLRQAAAEKRRLTDYVKGSQPREVAVPTNAAYDFKRVYHADGRLPANFTRGMIINSLLLLLMLAALFLLNHFRYYRPGFDMLSTRGVKLDIPANAVTRITLDSGSFFHRLMSVFNGRGFLHFRGAAVTLDGTPAPRRGMPVCLLQNHGDLPGKITVQSYFDHHQKRLPCDLVEFRRILDNQYHIQLEDVMGKLTAEGKADVMLALAESMKNGFIILHDFLRDLPEEYIDVFQQSLGNIKARGNTVLFFAHKGEALTVETDHLYSVKVQKKTYVVRHHNL